MNALTNGATIIVESNGKTYHTLDDWGLAIQNNDCVGNPQQSLNYIDVVGRNSPIDVSDALIGRPSYTHRAIKIKCGGIRQRNGWDDIISDIRNKINGRVVKLIFDNDKDNYWYGRISLTDFDRFRELGTFNLEIPKADPYKYEVQKASEPWLWDIFSFVDGVIRSYGEIKVNGTTTFTIVPGNMYVTPEFQVSTATNLSVTKDGRKYDLKVGKNRFPSLKVNGDEEVTLIFEGKGTVTIDYRGGSL